MKFKLFIFFNFFFLIIFLTFSFLKFYILDLLNSNDLVNFFLYFGNFLFLMVLNSIFILIGIILSFLIRKLIV
jgi:hypothetical protein